MIIYIDGDFKCHVSAAEGRREIETGFFNGKCPEWIESYRFVPEGGTWTREDGEEFAGAEMISPVERPGRRICGADGVPDREARGGRGGHRGAGHSAARRGI